METYSQTESGRVGTLAALLPDLIQAAQANRESSTREAYVQQVVNQAVPLTPENIDFIRGILLGRRNKFAA